MTKIFERIDKLMGYIGEKNGSETERQLVDKGKKFNEKISDKVEKALKNIPVYSNGEETYKTVYPELCLYSHNNTDSIIERFFVKIGDNAVFSELKKDENINAVMYMFVSCTKNILEWIKENGASNVESNKVEGKIHCK